MSESKVLDGYNSAEHLYDSKGDAILAAMGSIVRHWGEITGSDKPGGYPMQFAVAASNPSIGVLHSTVIVGTHDHPEIYSIHYAEVAGKFGWVFDAIP